MTEQRTSDVVSLVVGVLVALAVAGLIAWARGEPGAGGRTPEWEGAPVAAGDAG